MGCPLSLGAPGTANRRTAGTPRGLNQLAAARSRRRATPPVSGRTAASSVDALAGLRAEAERSLEPAGFPRS